MTLLILSSVVYVLMLFCRLKYFWCIFEINHYIERKILVLFAKKSLCLNQAKIVVFELNPTILNFSS